jgi:hypothetical protein
VDIIGLSCKVQKRDFEQQFSIKIKDLSIPQDQLPQLFRLGKGMAAPEVAAAIQENLTLAKKLHVTGTPTVIVGDHFLTEPSAQIDFSKEVHLVRSEQ